MKKSNESSLNRLKSALKKENMRLTDQRLSIWMQINQSKEHLDVEDIFFQLRKKGSNVSRATIYRTLDVLVKNDLILLISIFDCYSDNEIYLILCDKLKPKKKFTELFNKIKKFS